VRVLFFFICLVFFGCKSKTEADTINLNISEQNLAKANRVIDDYLKDTLYSNINYYNSKIIKVDSVFIYSNEDSINSVLNCIDSIESEFYSLYDVMEDQEYIFKGENKNYSKDTMMLNEFDLAMRQKLDKVVDLFNSSNKKFTGWDISYQYVFRVKNNNEKNIWGIFYFNPEFTKIIKYYNRPPYFFDKNELSELQSRIFEISLKIARLKFEKQND
jgi:hypothetical protein